MPRPNPFYEFDNGSTSTNIYHAWCDEAVTVCTTTSTVWVSWCDTISTVSTDTTWYQWSNDVRVASNRSRHITPQEVAQMEASERVAQARAAEESARAMAAHQRAEILLLENLSLKQQAEYREHQHFVVEHGQRRYRIRRGRIGNVDVIGRDGRITHRLCAHPAEAVPDCDTMLAQKLMLEHDDEAFVRIANRREASEAVPVLPALIQ